MNPVKTVSLAGLVCAAAVSAAAGTKMISSWRAPDAGPLNFQKVLVLCIAPHDSQRQFAENELVGLMKRTRGVPSYSVMTPADVESKEKVLAFMTREAFDGAVVMRFVGAGQKTHDPGVYIPTYTGFWDYYSVAAPMMRDPGYIRMDRLLQMETQVFATKGDKLVWAGLSETKNPDSAKQLVADVARAVAADLKKQRLIQ